MDQKAVASGNGTAIVATRDVYLIHQRAPNSRGRCTSLEEPASNFENKSGTCLRGPLTKLIGQKADIQSEWSLRGVVTAANGFRVPYFTEIKNQVARKYVVDLNGAAAIENFYVKDRRPCSTCESDRGTFEGDRVVCSQRDGAWKRYADEIEHPTQTQARELQSLCADGQGLFPDYPVSEGATWELDGAQIALMLGLGDALRLTGSATVELTSIDERNGRRLANLTVKRFEAEGLVLGNDDTPARFHLGGYGRIVRLLDSYLDVKSSFDGSWRTELLDGGAFNGRLTIRSSAELVK